MLAAPLSTQRFTSYPFFCGSASSLPGPDGLPVVPGHPAVGAGLRDRFREAERVALELLPSHPDFAPAMFIHLAEGARALREWDRARGYAVAAQDSAVQTQSPTLEEEAAALVGSIERREPAPAQAESTSEIESLTMLVLSRLERWKAPGEEPEADESSD